MKCKICCQLIKNNDKQLHDENMAQNHVSILTDKLEQTENQNKHLNSMMSDLKLTISQQKDTCSSLHRENDALQEQLFCEK
jgi:predicted RNase H-like nuclease (RuvC/YqgF family)